jgi:hypothetical protein
MNEQIRRFPDFKGERVAPPRILSLRYDFFNKT